MSEDIPSPAPAGLDVTSGVLVVDKPRGMTSHDVVSRLRRLLGTRRVGHAGTLDPMATGVLVALVGEATKLGPYLTLHTKTYRARVALGAATDTLDAEGKVVATAEVPERVRANLWVEVEKVLDVERARREQIPPAFSAIQVDGRRSYDRARAGESFELAARPVAVERMTLIEEPPGEDPLSVDIELTVSKGYYVRSFARDLGEGLGTLAHLTALRRTASGPFSIASAVSLQVGDGLARSVIPLADAATQNLPSGRLSLEGAGRARQGKLLGASDFIALPPEPAAGTVSSAWFDPAGRLVAIGERTADGAMRVLRGFVPEM